MAIINIVEHDDGAIEVWADVPGAEMEGIIVGIGQSRQEAVSDAVRTLEALTEQLQSPPSVWETDDVKYTKDRLPSAFPDAFRIFTHKSGVDL